MKNESFLFSYEDHDGSISIAAAVPPMRSRGVSSSKECAHGNSYSRLCPVVLSLHGTGVDVQMQADSYKFKDRGAKDSQPYIFGVQNAWLIAATRGGAHNWEYTGHLAALKALSLFFRHKKCSIFTWSRCRASIVCRAFNGRTAHGYNLYTIRIVQLVQYRLLADTKGSVW